MKIHLKLATLMLLVMGTMANAATVSLVPLTPVDPVTFGDTVSFRIDIDFSAEGGTLGGSFDLTFDESQLGLVSFTNTVILGDPSFGRVPDVLPGLLQGWAVGEFNGIQSGTVGEVSFDVLPGATSSLVALGPSIGFPAPWVSSVDFISEINPVYNQIQVNAVPLPAAAWLFGSGILGLIGMARRKKLAA